MSLLVTACIIGFLIGNAYGDDSSSLDCGEIDNVSIFGSTLCGSLIFPTDSTFVSNAEQYAYYSYPTHFSPSMLLIAECDEDVRLILDFSLQCDYKISLRSGGHQFAGLSSCNSNDYDCIQVILKNYDTLDIYANNQTAVAEVGVSIETLFKELDSLNLFIPGGAESSVGLGGHCQTGGVGYLMRSFGLFTDQIYAFDMMIWNGTVLHIQPQTYPDLFWAVLGGGPGNWGVILRLYMNVFSNNDYPNVVAVNYVWIYEKEIAEQTGLTWVELNNNNVINDYSDTLMLWAIVPNFDSNVHMVILQYLFIEDRDDSMHDWDNFGYENTLKPFLDLNISDPVVGAVIRDRTISSLVATDFLIPSVLVPEYEYSIRAQGTTQEWNDEFIYDVVGRADALINNNVNQMGVNITIGLEILFEKYGGAVMNDEKFNRTSLAWRDLKQGMGIRIFYKNEESKVIQSNWQEESWREWLSTPEFYNNEDIRYYGYSHVTNAEGEFNMAEQWMYYYRTQERYERLKQIKQEIDPCDVFHFAFSIPVEDDSNCPVINPTSTESESTDGDASSEIDTIFSFIFVLLMNVYFTIFETV